MNLGGEPEQSALERYGVDLTARAKAGKLDPVIGRDAVVARTIQVLSRRTKNNPVLIGSAGTGKTALPTQGQRFRRSDHRSPRDPNDDVSVGAGIRGPCEWRMSSITSTRGW